jgi:hypothetical protein
MANPRTLVMASARKSDSLRVGRPIGWLVVQEDNDASVTVTVDIAATPAHVWHVLTAFDSYSTWHPTLSADGTVPEVAAGAGVDLRLSGGVAGDQAFTTQIVEADAPYRLAWQAGVPDVFFGRHTFELSPLPQGGTRVTDTERWTGTMAASVVAEHRAALQAEYARSAAALKTVAEAEQE